jgi:hypothetical protein
MLITPSQFDIGGRDRKLLPDFDSQSRAVKARASTKEIIEANIHRLPSPRRYPERTEKAVG